MLTDKQWSDLEYWNLEDWSRFWVPYAGNEETENSTRTQFLKGSHREIQILRRKFAGDVWNMMFGISAVNHEGKQGAEFFCPESAVDIDKSIWGKFPFSKSKGVKD